MMEFFKRSDSVKRTSRKRLATLVVGVGFMLSMVGGLALPFLTPHAHALDAYTNFDMASDGAGSQGSVSTATCQAYFMTLRKDANMLNKYFMPNFSSILGKNITGMAFDTFLGFKNDTDSNGQESSTPLSYIGYDHVVYVLNGVDTSDIQVIKFKPADGPTESSSDNPGQLPDTHQVCSGLEMLPVSNTEWRGYQYNTPSVNKGDLGYYSYARFQLKGGTPTGTGTVSGTIDYYNSDAGIPATIDINVEPTGGAGAGGGPGGITVGAATANWVNASKIQITGGGSGKQTGEIYQKANWEESNGWSFYFLAGLGPNSGSDRQNLINAPQCDTPLTAGGDLGATCADAAGSSNCKPFIAVHTAINLDLKDGNGNPLKDVIGTMQGKINRLGAQNPDIFVDYDPTTCHATAKYTTTVGATDNATVWFYYSTQNKAFLPVFSGGKGNENHYIGQYAAAGQNIYAGGQTGCEGAITAANIPANGTFQVQWRLTDTSLPCSQPIYFGGQLIVKAVGGADGEAGFTQAQTDIQNNAQALQLSKPEIVCNVLGGVMNWLICPIISAAQAAVGKLDDAINSTLTIDANKIFGDGDPTARAYHKAWASFRVFALALIVIAGLVMVIAQASGVEVIDAYTVRKVLPRLLVAAIGITLSWQLLRFAVEVSNDLGNGIRSIIYTPFTALTQNQATNAQLGGGSGFVLALIGTGGALAFGPIGLLTFVVTGMFAALIAFGLIVFREVLIIFLAMVSPFALACYILPNTQKPWKLWLDSTAGALLVFLFISGFIAVGRVFSVTFFNQGGTVGQLIGVIAYFAPYFLIPLAFRLAGGAVATVGGLVNDRSRGVFDRLRGARQRQVQQRGKRWQEGALFNPESRATRFLGLGTGVNALGSMIGGASQPGGLLRMGGAAGRAARANRSFATMEEYSKEDHNFAAQMDNEDAMVAHAMQNNRDRLAQLRWFQTQNDDGTWSVNEERINNAIASSRSIQMTGRSITAAGDAVARSGKVISNNDEAEQLYGAVARGNGSLEAAVRGRYRWVSRQVGRNDIGRGSTWEAVEEMNLGDFAKLKPLATRNPDFINDIVQMAATGQTNPSGRDPSGRVQYNTPVGVRTAANNSPEARAELTRNVQREMSASMRQEGQSDAAIQAAVQNMQPLTVEQGRSLNPSEMQHLGDILYGMQNYTYSNAYQQQAVQGAWSNMPQEIRDRAQANYSAKFGSRGAAADAADAAGRGGGAPV